MQHIKEASMGIIYFSTDQESKAENHLLYALKKSFSDVHIEAFAKTEHLKTKLEQQYINTKDIIILMATSEDSLIDIYFMNHLLRTLPSILVLPDSEKHTIALGNRIKANFQFSSDNPHDDILFIVGQLLDTARPVITINSLRNPMNTDDFSGGAIPSRGKVSNL
jgi:hypothetical protein